MVKMIAASKGRVYPDRRRSRAPFCRLVTVLGVLVALVLLTHSPARATSPADEEDDPLLAELEAEFACQAVGFPDPLEGLNRPVFKFNRVLDRWIINPIASAYGFVVPTPAKRAVRRFFANLDSPSIFANDLLQRQWLRAATTATRFAVNTTVGIGGLFEAATPLGLERHWSDFGQTLALIGVPSGPYLVMPLFGPTTMRDGTGTLVSVFFRPTTYLLGPAEQLFYNGFYGGGSGIVTREENAQGLRAVEESSVDFYASLRNAYYQVRIAEIYQDRERGASSEGTALAGGKAPCAGNGTSSPELARSEVLPP